MMPPKQFSMIAIIAVCLSVFQPAYAWQIQNGKDVRLVEVGNALVANVEPIFEQKWDWIKHKVRNRRLVIVDRILDRIAIDIIAGITELEYLSLPGCGITDLDLPRICTLPNLVCLNLSRNDITDQAAEQLHKLQQLKFLILDETQVGDRTVELVASRAQLGRFWLSRTRVTGESLPCLAMCRDLVELKLTGDKILPQHWRGLMTLTSLQYLEISNTNITADGLKCLTALVNLRQLGVFNCPAITDGNVAVITMFPFLSNLDVGRSSITNAGVEKLTAIKSLKILGLISTGVTDGVIGIIERHPQWESVNISHCEVRYEVLNASSARQRIEGTNLMPSFDKR